MYEIRYSPGMEQDLLDLRVFVRRQVMDAIVQQLSHTPTRPTKHRKRLHGLIAPFETEPPVWELRVGEYRVFYDVNGVEQIVYVRAVRHKPPHRTTEDIL